jgi:hypothetical protein
MERLLGVMACDRVGWLCVAHYCAGLVRTGVAPDHPEVKSVQNDFEAVAENPRLRFLGNMGIDRDVSVVDLLPHYNAVVLAYGAAVRMPCPSLFLLSSVKHSCSAGSGPRCACGSG